MNKFISKQDEERQKERRIKIIWNCFNALFFFLLGLIVGASFK